MKFSESWLRDILNPGLSSAELSHLLTMAGLEVEAREPVAPAFDHVVVGVVKSEVPHPNADRLRLCQVDAGDETLQIVCGAPNVRPGMRVPCARVGAKLPGLVIGKANVRGIDSYGMLCSARELGLGDDQGGVLDLGSAAPAGTDLRVYLDLDDHLFTLKLTPNRGDCLSLYGLARELAALTRAKFDRPVHRAVAPSNDDQRAIELEAGEACPRYCGRVISGVDASARTPQWMVRRLERCGLRPISPVVDVTNYVMLEIGQPLHAFDLKRLHGKVHVRFARAGEVLTLLNGQEVLLGDSHLVIADDRSALALAGVMGGESSAVNAETDVVFLESAFFAPETVAQASRGLDIASDAAHRFERGVDFAITREAIERATELILQVCGGSAGPVTEALGQLPEREAITLRPERVNRVLGIDIGRAEIGAILRRLDLSVQECAGAFSVTPPSFRFDLAIEEDLIEEIARIHGYERIAPTLPLTRVPLLAVSENEVSTHALKRALAARDYFEVVTFGFVDRQLEADYAGEVDPIALANPIASQMSVMRSSLIGSLVECVRFNVARKQERVRVFEVATCFKRDAEAYLQTERIAGICYGNAHAEQWGVAARSVDFFDVKGDLEAVLGDGTLTFVADLHPALHPGQSARVLFGGKAVGWLGALHPRWMQKYELPGAAVAFELDLAPIRIRRLPMHQTVARFPPVRRDIAMVVDETASAEVLHAAIGEVGGMLIGDVALFDVYRGKGIQKGKKSLAFRVLLQDTEKTLTDAEVEGVMQRIVRVLKEKHGATLRF